MVPKPNHEVSTTATATATTTTARRRQDPESHKARGNPTSAADRVITKAQVRAHNREDDAWVIVDNYVYDVTDFVEQHPGGVDILLDHLGGDVTDTLQNTGIHKHSRNAYSMLDGYRIGRLADSQDEHMGAGDDIDTVEVARSPDGTFNRKGWGRVDFRKPIVAQAGMLGLEYEQWVNTDPLHFKEPVRFFGPAWMERASRTPWYAIPLTWLPLVTIMLLYIYHLALPDTVSPQDKLLFLAQRFCVGFVAWFPIEYLLHKYAFHWDWLAQQGYFITNILHFLLHGVHHKVPMDRMRLVAPHAFHVFFGVPILLVLRLFVPMSTALPIGCGIAIGYTLYDMTHYSLHHASNPKDLLFPFNIIFSSKHFQRLRTHHLIHHFAPEGHNYNFGITNMIIDKAVDTYRATH